MMGTNTLDQKNLAARLIAAMVVLLFFTTAPTKSVAVEFGFLVENFDPLTDGLALNADTDDAGDGEDDAGDGEDDPDDDQEFGNVYADPEQVPEVVAGQFVLPPLGARTTAIKQIGNGRSPKSFRSEHMEDLVPLPESAAERGMSWNWSVAQWAASNTFSYPLYFEDRMLERHGHDRWGCLQPAASGARFFATIPMLPYLMTVNRPCDCEYKLGHYRAGSCAPKMIQRPPLERKAVVAEAIFLGGGIAIFP